MRLKASPDVNIEACCICLLKRVSWMDTKCKILKNCSLVDIDKHASRMCILSKLLSTLNTADDNKRRTVSLQVDKAIVLLHFI